MKHLSSLVISLLFILACVPAAAQQLPNPGFEDWSGTAFDGHIQLKSWNASNVEQTYLGITARANMIEREGNAHSGSYCAHVKNTRCEVAGIGATSPAWITLGVPFSDITNGISGATAGTYGGVSWTWCPDTLQVWLKHTFGSENSDEIFSLVYYSWVGNSKASSYKAKNGSCVTIAEKTNEESDIRQKTDRNGCGTTVQATQVAEGWVYSKAGHSNWTLVKVPITYYNDLTPEKMNIILSGGNYPNFRANDGIYEGNGVYLDDVSLIYSSCAHELYIGGRKYKGFSPEVTEYTYSLGQGVTTIPAISLKRSGRTIPASEMTITNGAVDGAPTVITVNAQDGSSSHTYTIHFVSQASNNARLASISVNGNPIAGFNAYLTSYNVALPYGTMQAPQVEAVAQDAGATITITQPTSPTGSAAVVVTAQDGSTSLTYRLSFSVESMTDVTLSDILLDGVSLTGFAPQKTNYTVELPAEATEAPVVTPVSAYADGVQQIDVLGNDLEQGCRIRVSIPGTTYEKTYRITYRRASVSSPYLKAIVLGSDTLADFSPMESDYDIILGDAPVPTVTPVPQAPSQQIGMVLVDDYGTSSILVLSSAGEEMIYHLHFMREARAEEVPIDTVSPNVLLGLAISDYGYLDLSATEATTFTIPLPYGSTQLHVESWVKSFAGQQVLVAEGGILHPTVLTVLSGRPGAEKKVYTLVPSVPSHDPAYLTSLSVNGTPVTGFDSAVYNYVVSLTSDLASVTYTLPEGATAEVVDSTFKSYTLLVESDTYQHTYRLSFYYPSDLTFDTSFEQWNSYTNSNVSSGNSGSIPRGWHSALDATTSGDKGTYYPANTLSSSTTATAGSKAASLSTIYITTSAEAMPGFLSLSQPTVTVGTYYIFSHSASTLSYGSPIAFRNTPDSVALDYRLEAYNKLTGWRFSLMQNGMSSVAFTENFAGLPKSTWRTMRAAIPYDSDFTPSSLDILISTAHTDNLSSYYVGANGAQSKNQFTSTMLFDNLRLIYSSQLSGLKVSGMSAALNGRAFSLALPSEWIGSYDCVFTGEVTDQGQQITWTSPSAAAIRNYAEDGSYTDYTLSITRPASTVATYTAERIDSLDLRVRCTSPYATLVLDTLKGGFVVRVQPESGAAVSHVFDTVTIVPYTPSSVSTLSALRIGSRSVAGFASGVTAYADSVSYVDYHSGADFIVSAVPTSSAASVALSLSADTLASRAVCLHYVFAVTAEDSSSLTTYRLDLTIGAQPLTTLQMIYLDGDSLAGFLPDEEDYSLALPYGAGLPAVTWTLDDPTASVALSQTADEVVLTVTNPGAEPTVYTLRFTFALSPNNALADLRVKGTTIDGFHRDSLSYALVYPVGTPEDVLLKEADIEAVPEEAEAVATVSLEANHTLTIMVTAPNGDIRVYTIHQSVLLSSEARLEMIWLDSVPLAGFSPDSLSYTIMLPAVADVPSVMASPLDTLADVEYGSLESASTADYEAQRLEIDGVAEDGTRVTYTLLFRFANWMADANADADDYLFYHISGTESYMAVAISEGLRCAVYDLAGHLLMVGDVPVADPGYVDVDVDESGRHLRKAYDGVEGLRFDVPHMGETYFYVFFNNMGKRVAKGGKFSLRP